LTPPKFYPVAIGFKRGDDLTSPYFLSITGLGDLNFFLRFFADGFAREKVVVFIFLFGLVFLPGEVSRIFYLGVLSTKSVYSWRTLSIGNSET